MDVDGLTADVHKEEQEDKRNKQQVLPARDTFVVPCACADPGQLVGAIDWHSLEHGPSTLPHM